MRSVTASAKSKEVGSSGLLQPTGTGLIRRRLVAGVVTLIPIVVTLFVVAFLSEHIIHVFGPLVDRILRDWELIGQDDSDASRIIKTVEVVLSWLLAFIAIYLVGWLSSFFVIRRVIGLGESILKRVPIIKTVYGTMKQIVETLQSRRALSAQKVAVIEYPRRGIYVFAFVTGEMRFANREGLFVNLFVPTTPNPTSGFLLLLPSEDVLEAPLTVEQASKLIISGGILTLDRFPLTPYTSDIEGDVDS